MASARDLGFSKISPLQRTTVSALITKSTDYIPSTQKGQTQDESVPSILSIVGDDDIDAGCTCLLFFSHLYTCYRHLMLFLWLFHIHTLLVCIYSCQDSLQMQMRLVSLSIQLYVIHRSYEEKKKPRLYEAH